MSTTTCLVIRQSPVGVPLDHRIEGLENGSIEVKEMSMNRGLYEIDPGPLAEYTKYKYSGRIRLNIDYKDTSVRKPDNVISEEFIRG